MIALHVGSNGAERERGREGERERNKGVAVTHFVRQSSAVRKCVTLPGLIYEKPPRSVLSLCPLLKNDTLLGRGSRYCYITDGAVITQVSPVSSCVL